MQFLRPLQPFSQSCDVCASAARLQEAGAQQAHTGQRQGGCCGKKPSALPFSLLISPERARLPRTQCRPHKLCSTQQH